MEITYSTTQTIVDTRGVGFFGLNVNGDLHKVEVHGQQVGMISSVMDTKKHYAAGTGPESLELLVTRCAHRSNLAGWREQQADTVTRV
jgi:hypothetical protein